jgi:hypothetical protein
MVRQVPLQWPGAIPRLRPVDCSTTPSYSMKWRPRADHGQKHETGGWIQFELDDQEPITEAAEPKPHFRAKVARFSRLTAVLTGISRPKPVTKQAYGIHRDQHCGPGVG